MRRIALGTIGWVAVLWLSACSLLNPSSSPPASDASPIASEPSMPSPTPVPTIPEPRAATLLAVGDIMVHMPQLPAYYDDKADRYRLTDWFEYVEPLFQEGDWVVGNLETTLAGADLKYTGFPRFNAPGELADALADAGVDLLSTANNHAMDRGFIGIERTLNRVRQSGIVPFGTSASAEERRRLVIEERDGIRVGFLAYTYSTNGIPIPEDKPFAVDLIDIETMAADIRRLRDAGADAVSVSLHFGVEYQRKPNDEQIAVARAAVAAGADIVLGSHPHVVQPYDIVEVPASESADGTARRGIVIYSLGNFISNQTGDWQNIGLIFSVRLVKTFDADGSSVTTWDAFTAEPTWVRITKPGRYKRYAVIPLTKALEERNLPDMTEAGYREMQMRLDAMRKHLASMEPAAP